MPVKMLDPAARPLNLPPPADRTAVSGAPRGHEGERGMRRRRNVSFTLYSARGRGWSYRSYAKADSAARWISQETGESVHVVNESTGQSWEVSIGGVSDP